MRMTKLSEFAYFVTTKIDVKKLTRSNYIGVDNMLQNKNGITQSEYLPDNGYAIAFQKNDILIGNIRPYLKKIWLATFDGGCSQDVLCLRCNNSCLSGFIFSLLSQDCFFDYVMKGSKGTRMARGDKKHILNYKFCDIPNKEQIGQLITNLNNKIFLNNQINDNLSQQLALLYKYWFEDYNFPNESQKPYAKSNGVLVYNPLIKRDIPTTWKVKNLLEVVSWETNSQPPKSEFIYEPKDGYIRFIQNRDFDSDSHYTFIPFNKNLSLVDEFDILMDKYGDAGKTRFGLKGTYNVALAKIAVKESKYKEYVRAFLSSPAIYNYLHNACMASTRASLNEDNLSFINIVIPSENIATLFEKQAHLIIEKLIKNRIENNQLTKYRDELLPLLLNGQVVIK